MLLILETLAMEYRPALEPELLDTLLRDLARGDREALAELYRRTRTAVYGLALSYLKGGGDAEDVTQDTFVRAWENAPAYRSQGSPLSWLLAIARNLSLMKLRQRGRSAELSEEAWDALPAPPDALGVEDRAVLQTALAALDAEERQVVLLHAVTGLKHREIAALLELPLATALSKYHRALKKLREKLEGDDAL